MHHFIISVEKYPLKLTGGKTVFEGNVIFEANNIIGSVCDASWDITDASVLCQQLGFNPPISIYTESQFGQVNTSFDMIDINCIGHEVKLLDCPYNISPSMNCGKKKGAGVQCRPPGKWIYFRTTVYHR